MVKINEVLAKVFTEDRVKWIKGIIAGFLIIAISNFGAPFTFFINGLGWHEIWVNYILIVYNAGVILLLGVIVFFLGKPIFISNPEEVEPPTQ